MKSVFKIALVALLATGAVQAQSNGSSACPSGQSSGNCNTISGPASPDYCYDGGGDWFDFEGTPSPTYSNQASPSLTRNLPGYDTRPSSQKKPRDIFDTRDKSQRQSCLTNRR
jgi:hypothetical protein